MSIKLSPVVSRTGLNFKEYNSCIFQLTNGRPQQRKLTLTPFTPPRGNHRGKTTPLTSLLTSCKNGGGEGTPYHVGRMQHTQDSNTSAWNGCLCPNARKGHGDRMGGNPGPSFGPPHPKGHHRGGRYCPPHSPKITPSLKGRSCIEPG